MTQKSKKKPSQAAMASKKANAPRQEQQNRREIAGIIFVVAALFAIICCFDTEASLIGMGASLVSGLIGQLGRYMLPAVLVWTGLVLFTSKGKPVTEGIICSFLLHKVSERAPCTNRQ